MKCSIKLIAFCCTTICTSILAQPTTEINVPTLNDAKVFAKFTDKLPAVINYFTQSNEQHIIKFYQKSYGEALSQERKRGRLTLTFASDQNTIRIIISKQNKMQQVDVLLLSK